VSFYSKDLQCTCGERWQPEDTLTCSVKCFNENAFWEVNKRGSGWSLGIEDECNGCGCKIVEDVPVKLNRVE